MAGLQLQACQYACTDLPSVCFQIQYHFFQSWASHQFSLVCETFISQGLALYEIDSDSLLFLVLEN